MPASGGKTYHVYPTKVAGAENRAGLRRDHVRLQLLLRRRRYRARWAPAREAGDTILVHAGTYAYHWEFYGNQTAVNATTTFEGTYYLTADGTPEKPIVIKAAGDGEVDPRRPRQLQPVQRQGGRLQLLRRHHVQEHADRDLGGDAVHCRLEGADREALPVRGRRHGRVHELLRVERLSTSPTACSSAATIRSI
jgi:hypothetical protein